MAIDKTKVAHERAKMAARAKVLNSRLAIAKARDDLQRAQTAVRELTALGARKPRT